MKYILKILGEQFDWAADLKPRSVWIWADDPGGCGCADCQPWGSKGFPEISMHETFPWGGFGATPLTARAQAQWNALKEGLAGGFPYSEEIMALAAAPPPRLARFRAENQRRPPERSLQRGVRRADWDLSRGKRHWHRPSAIANGLEAIEVKKPWGNAPQIRDHPLMPMIGHLARRGEGRRIDLLKDRRGSTVVNPESHEEKAYH